MNTTRKWPIESTKWLIDAHRDQTDNQGCCIVLILVLCICVMVVELGLLVGLLIVRNLA